MKRHVVLGAALCVVAACTPAATLATPSRPPTAPATQPSSTTPGTSATPVPTLGAGEQWIAYQWQQDDGRLGVFLVRADGRDKHLVLTASAGHPDWSPDGNRLVVDTEPDDGEEIWMVSPDGKDRTVLTCDGADCGPVAAPAWSPDGRQLAFQRSIGEQAGDLNRIAIEVIDLATGATRIVARSPEVGDEYVEYVGPRWSPDGTRIVFTVMRYPVPPTDENILGSSIATVAADGSEADAPVVLTNAAMFGTYPDWGSNNRIVFSTYPLGSFQDTTKAVNLYSMLPDGSGLEQVTHYTENDDRASEPTWTPDGRQIVFVNILRNPENSWGERLIALIDADGSDLTLIPIPGADGENWYGTHSRMRPTP